MGNGPSDRCSTPHSPQIMTRPDDISEIESTVLPQISLLSATEQDHIKSVLARQKEEDQNLQKHLTSLSDEILNMKKQIKRSTGSNSDSCPLCRFSLDAPSKCALCQKIFCEFCCTLRFLKGDSPKNICLACWKSTMLMNNSCAWDTSPSLAPRSPKGPKSVVREKDRLLLSPSSAFGSRSYVLEHHRPSEPSTSHKKFPVNMFSKTKQIVKLPLRRHDHFQTLDSCCIATELPTKPANPIKIKVGFYLEDGRLTVKVCEAVNINYTDGAPCFVSLTSTSNKCLAMTYYGKVHSRACNWNTFSVVEENGGALLDQKDFSFPVTLRLTCKTQSANLTLGEKRLNITWLDVNKTRWYVLEKPDYTLPTAPVDYQNVPHPTSIGTMALRRDAVIKGSSIKRSKKLTKLNKELGGSHESAKSNKSEDIKSTKKRDSKDSMKMHGRKSLVKPKTLHQSIKDSVKLFNNRGSDDKNDSRRISIKNQSETQADFCKRKTKSLHIPRRKPSTNFLEAPSSRKSKLYRQLSFSGNSSFSSVESKSINMPSPSKTFNERKPPLSACENEGNTKCPSKTPQVEIEEEASPRLKQGAHNAMSSPIRRTSSVRSNSSFGLSPKNIPYKRRRSSFIEAVLQEIVEPERIWTQLESQVNYPCDPSGHKKVSVIEQHINERHARKIRLSRDQSQEHSLPPKSSPAFRKTKSKSMVDIRSYPQFSKERVLQTPLKQPTRDVRFQKRLPPDGEDYNLTMRSTPTMKLPKQKTRGAEIGWICLSVKWGYGGRIETYLNAIKLPSNSAQRVQVKVSLKSSRREVICRTRHRIRLHGDETPVNKKICFDQNQLNTVLKVSCKFSWWRRAELIIPLDQADKTALGQGAWFSLVPVSLFRTPFRKGEYDVFDGLIDNTSISVS